MRPGQTALPRLSGAATGCSDATLAGGSAANANFAAQRGKCSRSVRDRGRSRPVKARVAAGAAHPCCPARGAADDGTQRVSAFQHASAPLVRWLGANPQAAVEQPGCGRRGSQVSRVCGVQRQQASTGDTLFMMYRQALLRAGGCRVASGQGASATGLAEGCLLLRERGKVQGRQARQGKAKFLSSTLCSGSSSKQNCERNGADKTCQTAMCMDKLQGAQLKPCFPAKATRAGLGPQLAAPQGRASSE